MSHQFAPSLNPSNNLSDLGNIQTALANLGALGVISTTANINGKATGSTALFTVPTSRTLYLTGAVVTGAAASGITISPTVGIGNSAGTSNLFAATLTGITALNAGYNFTSPGTTIALAAGTIVYANLPTAATGTSLSLTIDLLGYLK